MTTKKITLPTGLKNLMVGTREEWIRNPFSGEECKLTPQAVAVYDFIMGAQMMHPNGMPPKASSGLDWFRKHYPKEYMTLLD